jgi:PRTRC genetic system protein A
MIPQVGYLTRQEDGLHGTRGMLYDYVMAENGVFVEAEGTLLAARVQVSQGLIRGLQAIDQRVVLRYGKIPALLFQLALNVMLTDVSRERYIAIVWKDGYHLHIPDQTRKEVEVKYNVADNVILDLHSHGVISAGFSSQDNSDEQGLKLYGVVGQLDKTPVLKLRIGVYGYFTLLTFGQIFEGSLVGAVEKEITNKELALEL